MLIPELAVKTGMHFKQYTVDPINSTMYVLKLIVSGNKQ